MEIIKLENGAYKISLNALEAQNYSITGEKTRGEKTSSAIRRLANELRASKDIELDDGKLSAEIYISKDGGCELFLSVSKREIVKPRHKELYRFEGLKSLLDACKNLFCMEYDGDGEVYYNGNSGSYYLLLSGVGEKDNKYAFLCECGSKMKATLLPYIAEHCKCICQKNAVEIFAKLL